MLNSSAVLFQPLSLVALPVTQRDRAVVSYFEVDGRSTVISVVGDDLWQLWMYHNAGNKGAYHLVANFRTMPDQFRVGVKEAYYRWWTTGMNGRTRPKASTFCDSVKKLLPFLRWLDEKGVQRLSAVTPFHTAAYAQAIGGVGKSPSWVSMLLLEVQRLYDLRHHSSDSLQQAPWPGASPCEIAGVSFGGRTSDEGRTKVIPDEAVLKVFSYAVNIVDAAPKILDERDTGLRVQWLDKEVMQIRDAILFLLGITTGLRNSEEVAIEQGGVRIEELHGVEFAWVKSTEFKMGAGESEWMAPIEAKMWLSVLERWAKPYQTDAERRLRELESNPPKESAPRKEVVAWSAKVRTLRLCRSRLFLTRGPSQTAVTTLGIDAANRALQRLFRSAGANWTPETHQMRRTFTVNAARHALGDIFYLKQHLKHRSLDMTSLYAMNDAQDESLFQEVFDQLSVARGQLIEHWLDPETIIGGGAAPIVKASQVATVESRRALAEDMSDKVMIRATGHGWCLAHGDGCGGQGLYEPTRCVGCRNSLFDNRHVPIWQGILSQQEELESDVENIGPGGVRRAQRDAQYARSVLGELGAKSDASR